VSRSRELLALLAGAQAGGFLAQPPGLDGDPLLVRFDRDLFAVDVWQL
jgi:hypothetical protein